MSSRETNVPRGSLSFYRNHCNKNFFKIAEKKDREYHRETPKLKLIRQIRSDAEGKRSGRTIFGPTKSRGIGKPLPTKVKSDLVSEKNEVVRVRSTAKD